VEEGAVYEGKLENLYHMYDMGVRMSTLTWNFENELAYPNPKGQNGQPPVADTVNGLKKTGIEFVEEKIVADAESRVTYQVLRNAFLKWCKQNGVTSLLSEREFASELKQSLAKLDIPYDKSKSGGERGISGIALK